MPARQLVHLQAIYHELTVSFKCSLLPGCGCSGCLHSEAGRISCALWRAVWPAVKELSAAALQQWHHHPVWCQWRLQLTWARE